MGQPRPPGGDTRDLAQVWGQTPAPGPAVDMPVGPAAAPLPALERASLVILRQFDVADEIDLARARELARADRADVRPKPRTTALLLSNPPVAVPLGARTPVLAGRSVEAEAAARVFDFGAISIRLRVALPPGTPWGELAAMVRAAQTDDALTRAAREEADALVARLAPALRTPHPASVYEDYVVAFVERFAEPVEPRALPREAVARLLLGEADAAALSPTEVDEALRQRTSYYNDDLCVAGWSTALVVEPGGDTDAVDVLELANAQLLELRYFDELLDRELARLYDETGRRARGPALLRSYGPLLRHTMAVMLEIAEFIERAEDALKILGDVYLARLYANAVASLRIGGWERSVTRKQELVRQAYDVLKNEVDASRDQWLELTIVALIVLELVLAFRGALPP